MELKNFDSKFESVIGRVTIGIIIFFSLFLCLEFLGRVFLPNRASGIEWKFRVESTRTLFPYVMFKSYPNRSLEWKERGQTQWKDQINSLGYRGKEPSRLKPQGEYRIFVLGGSSIFLGNPPIPVLLEEEFKKRGYKNVSVYNFGVVSAPSGMELARLLFDLVDCNPDLIVMYNGGNDILGPLFWDPRPGYPFNFIAYESNPTLESNISKYPLWTLIAYSSKIMRFCFPDFFLEKLMGMDKLRKIVGYKTEQWENNIALTYVNNLLKADKVSNAFGARFIGFLQPLIYYKDKLAPEEIKYLNETKSTDNANLFLSINKKTQRLFEEVSRKTNAKLIDLSDLFDNRTDQVFTDTIHIKQEYQEVVANELCNQIIKYNPIHQSKL